MDKKIIIGGACILFLFLMLGFVVANDPCNAVFPPVCTLAENVTNVVTSNGTLNLPNGTEIGANSSNFTNYITLQENRRMLTTEGLVEFYMWDKINCDHSPGQPDPCDP